MAYFMEYLCGVIVYLSRLLLSAPTAPFNSHASLGSLAAKKLAVRVPWPLVPFGSAQRPSQHDTTRQEPSMWRLTSRRSGPMALHGLEVRTCLCPTERALVEPTGKRANRQKPPEPTGQAAHR